MGIPATEINKIGEGSPHVVDWIERGEVDLVINTPVGTGARSDGYEIRSAAVARGIPCITTMAGGMAAARAIAAARRGEPARRLAAGDLHGAAAGHRARPRRDRDRARSASRPRSARRTAPVTGREQLRRLRRAQLLPTPAAPGRAAGQFYMLRADRWGGGDGERPFLPRAFSVLRAPAGDRRSCSS